MDKQEEEIHEFVRCVFPDLHTKLEGFVFVGVDLF